MPLPEAGLNQHTLISVKALIRPVRLAPLPPIQHIHVLLDLLLVILWPTVASALRSCHSRTGIPRELAEWVNAMQLSPMALIAVLTVIYLILGTALDGISMIVLTSAVVLPMIQKAGFDLIWFGIFIVLLVEIAEVTPPVGFNLFVLQNMTGKDSNTIARAAIPFFLCLVVCIVLVTLCPSIVTFLPDLVMGENK
jgi:TRAP-type C4-dicarboxylate transport system permease large subunit